MWPKVSLDGTQFCGIDLEKVSWLFDRRKTHMKYHVDVRCRELFKLIKNSCQAVGFPMAKTLHDGCLESHVHYCVLFGSITWKTKLENPQTFKEGWSYLLRAQNILPLPMAISYHMLHLLPDRILSRGPKIQDFKILGQARNTGAP